MIPVSVISVFIIFTIPSEQLIQKRWQQILLQQSICHQSIPKSALVMPCVELSIVSVWKMWQSGTLHLLVAVYAHMLTEHIARWNSVSENQNLAEFMIACISACE